MFIIKFVRDGEDKTNHTIQWKIVMNGSEFLTQGEEMNWDFRRGVEAGSAEDIAQRKAAAEAEALKKNEQANPMVPSPNLPLEQK